MTDVTVWLTQALNALVGGSVDSYRGALFQIEALPWMLAVLALTSLWFYGDPGVIAADAGQPTRSETRSRIMMAQAGVVAALIVALLLQRLVDALPPVATLPLQIPLPPDQVDVLRAAAAAPGSFPALPVIVLSATATLGYTLRPVFGYALAAAAAYFAALMIGSGLYWPQDVAAGIVMGIAGCSLGLLTLYPAHESWRHLAIRFQIKPALLYPAGFVFLLEMANGFPVLTWIINGVLDRVLPGI
jgi:hypothetical protein